MQKSNGLYWRLPLFSITDNICIYSTIFIEIMFIGAKIINDFWKDSGIIEHVQQKLSHMLEWVEGSVR